LTGLPWKVTVDDIRSFLGEEIQTQESGGEGITILNDTSGEAWVRVQSLEDESKALAKNNKRLGKRFIDVMNATEEELTAAMESTSTHTHMQTETDPASSSNSEQGVLRLRGLPYNATDNDIAKFFAGFGVAEGGIHVHFDHTGRPSGQAYVVFLNMNEVCIIVYVL
jgi:heterogeneous nuclear ribonucleoprotein F/H